MPRRSSEASMPSAAPRLSLRPTSTDDLLAGGAASHAALRVAVRRTSELLPGPRPPSHPHPPPPSSFSEPHPAGPCYGELTHIAQRPGSTANSADPKLVWDMASPHRVSSRRPRDSQVCRWRQQCRGPAKAGGRSGGGGRPEASREGSEGCRQRGGGRRAGDGGGGPGRCAPRHPADPRRVGGGGGRPVSAQPRRGKGRAGRRGAGRRGARFRQTDGHRTQQPVPARWCMLLSDSASDLAHLS